ncbi:MAG: hypothetical protein FJW53_04445 [Actinobacteria bacterium]|nr:hypothetical protein [Actinomycetota bacterium]
MPRYVVTVPSSKSAPEAFAYMSDMRLYPEWDRGISKVDLVAGSAPGLGAAYAVTVKGIGGRDTVFRYDTTEWSDGTSLLLVGKGGPFKSVDRITVAPTATGCDVTYDATLTFNGLLAPFNLALGLVFNKVGDRAARGLRRVLA